MPEVGQDFAAFLPLIRLEVFESLLQRGALLGPLTHVAEGASTPPLNVHQLALERVAGRQRVDRLQRQIVEAGRLFVRERIGHPIRRPRGVVRGLVGDARLHEVMSKVGQGRLGSSR